MKNKINILIIILFWTAFYLIIGALTKLIIPSLIILIFGIVITLTLISLLFKRDWFINKLKRKNGEVLLSVIFFSFFLLSIYTKNTYERSKQLYVYMISKGVQEFDGRVHLADESFVFKPLENARAFHAFPIGDPISMAYDNDRFSVPLSDINKNNIHSSVDLLFLACSIEVKKCVGKT
jgi:hypothetical protein